MAELIEVLQETIKNTVKALDLLETTYATVESVVPLVLTITETQLSVSEPVAVMSDNVRPKTAVVQGEEITLIPGLIQGDKVLLLKANSGQNYIVISKV